VRTPGSGNYRTLSQSMADRTVFQVDQAAPAAARFLRSHPKRSALSSVVGHLRLPEGRYYEEATENPKSLNEILQIISVRIFEQLPLAELLDATPDPLTRTNAHLYSQKLLLLID